MKKSLTMVLCLGLSLLLCGCGLEQLKEKYIEETGITPTPTSAPKERVYMDQYTGKVQTFDGINLVLQSDGRSVLFDASQASIETSHGLITGDEVSVIYEGRLDSPGSTEVKALKVVDDLHKETKLEEQTITGTLTRLTQNSLLFTDQSGRSILCPVTGASQYYSAGIREGISITVRYLGTIPDVDPGYGLTLEVPQIRVLSVSDTGSIPSKPKRSSSARVSNEYGDEYTVSYVCNLCGASAASPEEMEAHHQAAHAEAADFAFTEQQVLVAHHDAVTETVSHAGEFTEVLHEAEYETVHHEAVTHTIEWCSVCGVLKEQAH